MIQEKKPKHKTQQKNRQQKNPLVLAAVHTSQQSIFKY